MMEVANFAGCSGYDGLSGDRPMSVSTSETTTYDPAAAAERITRIDAPHASGATADSQETAAARASESSLEVAAEPTPDLIAAVAGQTLDARREQLQLQVSQLAGHLRERLREVDRREAAVNARASQLEADLRAGRLWLRERENAFQEREAELRRQIDDLRGRADHGLPSETGDGPGRRRADADLETREQELTERERQVQLRENEVRDRRFEIERQASALRHAQQLQEQDQARGERDLAQQRETLEAEFRERVAARESDFQTAESMLREHALQLDRDRLALSADRQEWAQQKARQEQALAERQRGVEVDLESEHERLAARQDWIERQKAGLEQVRTEILTLHRTSLEMRLVAEQLWSQIAGRMTPADVTQAVAQIRLKLTEQYRLEEQNLEARREELVALGERIAAQHGELKQLQAGLRDWAAAREAEIEQQAAALVERELALDHHEQQLTGAQRDWQADRRRYEQQIRELSGQLRTRAAV